MIHQALYSKLSTTVAITNLVSTRIFPTIGQQKRALPCLIYQRVNYTERTSFHGGVNPIVMSRFQLDCVASTPTQALTLAKQVTDALNGWTGIVEGVNIYMTETVSSQDGFELGTDEFAVVVEIEITHKE